MLVFNTKFFFFSFFFRIKKIQNLTKCSPRGDLYTLRSFSLSSRKMSFSLGAGHDGGDSSCPEKDKYLMATATNELNRDEPYTANPWRFSPCSIKSFREFFHS